MAKKKSSQNRRFRPRQMNINRKPHSTLYSRQRCKFLILETETNGRRSPPDFNHNICTRCIRTLFLNPSIISLLSTLISRCRRCFLQRTVHTPETIHSPRNSTITPPTLVTMSKPCPLVAVRFHIIIDTQPNFDLLLYVPHDSRPSICIYFSISYQ